MAIILCPCSTNQCTVTHLHIMLTCTCQLLLLLFTIADSWFGKAMSVQTCKMWILTYPEMIQQRPHATGKSETWLLENHTYHYNCCYHPRSCMVIMSVVSVCMSVCNTITFESLDVANPFFGLRVHLEGIWVNFTCKRHWLTEAKKRQIPYSRSVTTPVI